MHTCPCSPATIGTVNLTVCHECGSYAWTDSRGATIDPAEGMAAAYGAFGLVESLPSIGVPGGQVLVYRVPRRYRGRLGPLRVGSWVEIYPDLYASQDGANLLLAPADPTLTRNLVALG